MGWCVLCSLVENRSHPFKIGIGFLKVQKLTNDLYIFNFYFFNLFTTNRDTRGDRPGDGGTTTALSVSKFVQ